MNARRPAMQGCDDRMRGWAGDGERIRPRVGQVSVRQRLIELEFRNRFRIGRVQGDPNLPDIPGYLFDTGLNQRGPAYGTATCYPLPLSESDNNPNF